MFCLTVPTCANHAAAWGAHSWSCNLVNMVASLILDYMPLMFLFLRISHDLELLKMIVIFPMGNPLLGESIKECSW